MSVMNNKMAIYNWRNDLQHHTNSAPMSHKNPLIVS